MTNAEVPIVDLADLHAGPEGLARATDALRHAFGHFGLVYVRSHGVDADNVDALYNDFLAFCARPVEEKRPLGRGDLWYQRGWTPPNTEKAIVAGGQPDFKECYFACATPCDDADQLAHPEIYADNVWPEGMAGFDTAGFEKRYLQMGQELQRAGLGLLELCARALGLEVDVFTRAVNGGPHVTRLLKYLPLAPSQIGTGVLWGEEHTDFNLLTLLPGGKFYDPSGHPSARPDDRSGLYLRTRASEQHPRGSLVRGVAPPGCIVAQVGEQLEVLTGGTFLATPHVITTPATPGWSRASSAHFVHAHTNQVLFPLAPFVSNQSVREYGPPVLAGSYDIKTLHDIGLAPASAIAKLGYRHHARFAPIRVEDLD